MQRPIGVFDSGVGGLTVVKEIVGALPNESLVFVGDTARVPYGSRGGGVIRQFALELAAFLLQKDVKYLVAACNTISSTCLDAIQDASPVPVLGVVLPAVEEAVRRTKWGRIGVVGTRATVASRFYEKQVRAFNSDIEVFSQACPLFVPLAEEGLVNRPATASIAESYLAPLAENDIDVLILGCTHYPILASVIQAAIGSDVILVDSAKPTAMMLAAGLRGGGLLSAADATPHYELMVTDAERADVVAATFFGAGLPAHLKAVSLTG